MSLYFDKLTRIPNEKEAYRQRKPFKDTGTIRLDLSIF